MRVRGAFDSPSRWLWLIKWCVLATPHYPILLVLYLVYLPLTVIAGVAILISGRYPRPLFDFNVGVLRWSWRVMNYRFPMNSTDRYPPFTLASRPDYPADLQVDYPDRLDNRTVLVKSWLLGLPQVLMCWALEPVLQLLCVITALTLLITGTIPAGMSDLLLGIVRWRYRVAVYVSLMRDEYPPFRLDQGERWATDGAA
ncbi:DUF4389 domain-containing protein [Mycolicibacter minnesotensis]|uniref:DUF4389 domain-containing protein n=1 Tax=Mycolicibacter minnesotensis TaxID=1118379 RepID=A0AA91RLL9_9MYCO|nr:DUF4389 domain-containing protein [Mycolicibacter minnesotensis]